MRKKVFLLILICLFLTGSASSVDVIIQLKGSYFSPSEDAFKEIYGGGPMYGGEVNFQIHRAILFWVGGSFFSKQGRLTFTGEETRVKIIPAGGGIKVVLSGRGVDYYCGIGLNYYQYKESNPIGLAKKGGLGVVGRIGANVQLTAGLIIDLFVSYSRCRLKPADYEINIGGLEAGAGIGYSF